MPDLEPGQASVLLAALLPQLKREHKTTLKVIQAVPPDRGDYRPDPGSMSAFDLAWHLASAEIFFLRSAAAGEFSAGDPRPENVRDSAAVAAWYQQNFDDCFARVRALDGGHLLKPMLFHGFNQSALAWLQFVLTHSIHHRGQLTVYLRPMGAAVPPMHG